MSIHISIDFPEISQGESPVEIHEDVFGGLDEIWIGKEEIKMVDFFNSLHRVVEKGNFAC